MQTKALTRLTKKIFHKAKQANMIIQTNYRWHHSGECKEFDQAVRLARLHTLWRARPEQTKYTDHLRVERWPREDLKKETL